VPRSSSRTRADDLAQVSITVRLPSGTDVVFDLDPLAHPVDVAASSHRVNAAKIELKLVKQTLGIKWSKIEGDDESTSTMREQRLIPLCRYSELTEVLRDAQRRQRPRQVLRTPLRPRRRPIGTPSPSPLSRRRRSPRRAPAVDLTVAETSS
jgi:hypothetical protein